ncbi:hypothetical protein PGT21_003325 [Puccinia graminis f. sp. tritici]|uniref:Uncharacterized protein n=1 Tax=Puccinia graminis f. sp. tritici TaxID=56615 RepID=A0A5B0NIA6_PUCGR|nr:hypothetical protein PGTUg99_017600 [Puccinia graminis f. sp. tritici]KAA1105335.1 hypothetical protein PGT21_003325 [Puccinia graminis f. sp. tritici]
MPEDYVDSPSLTVRLCKAENVHHPPNWTRAPTQAQAEWLFQDPDMGLAQKILLEPSGSAHFLPNSVLQESPTTTSIQTLYCSASTNTQRYLSLPVLKFALATLLP